LEYTSKGGFIQAVHEMLPYLSIEDRHSSFLWAVEVRQIDLVDPLIQVSVDIRAEILIGGKYLLIAAGRLDHKVMNPLLGRGADPHCRPNVGNDLKLNGRPFIVSSWDESLRYSSLLLTVFAACKNKPKETKNIQECLDLLLNAEIDIQAASVDGKIALHYCVQYNPSVIEKLLQHGADSNATITTGDTPLHLFKRFNESAPILEILKRYGARVDVPRHRDKNTPLHTCGYSSDKNLDLECMQIYVKDWSIPNIVGNTPLYLTSGTN
jgi:ankyrin repeat protein